MKHHWKDLDKRGDHSVCILCKAERKIEHSKGGNIHYTSYKLAGEQDFRRSRPECKDTVNLKLF